MSLEFALHYLQKHYVPDDQFGVGPFLYRGEFELLADSNFEQNQMLILKILQGIVIECNSKSREVYLDILKNDPQLLPTLMKDDSGGSFHNWVRIFSSEGVFDIDCTPWFRSIEQKIRGTSKILLPRAEYFEIEPNSGVPFFIRTLEKESIIYSHLMGAPTVFYYGENFSDYTLRAEIRRDASFINKPKKFISLFLSAVDIQKNQETFDPSEDLDQMIAKNKVILGVMFSRNKRAIHEVTSSGELEAAVREREGDDFGDEIKRHVDALFILLKKLKSPIPIHRSKAGYIEFENHRSRKIIKW